MTPLATPVQQEQIDRAVAIHVMRWQEDVDCPPGYRPFWHGDDGFEGPDYEYWTPSTSIADAWQVVEKLSRPKYFFHLVRLTKGDWRCEFWLLGSGEPFRMAIHKDAPMAICLAALAVVGVEVPSV